MKKYIEILNVQCEDNTSPMASYIISQLPDNCSYFFDESGNLFVTRGSGLKPCIVAHMDTVQSVHRDKVFKQKKGRVYGLVVGTQAGIGADDKNGIYIALEILKQTSKPIKLLFTWGEESGGLGANATRRRDFLDVAYMLQFDRANAGDIIQYCSDDFMAIIEEEAKPFGYSEHWGVYTDVATLSASYGISAVNLSCGYYRAHTSQEYTVISELANALALGLHLVDTIPLKVYKYDERQAYKHTAYNYGSDWHDSNYNSYGDSFLDAGKGKKKRKKKVSKSLELYNDKLFSSHDANKYYYDVCDYCGVWKSLRNIEYAGRVCDDCYKEYHTYL